MNRCRSPHHQQTTMDGRVCALGNQSVHGNTWAMSGANWMATRQASPHDAHRHHNKCCNCKEASPAPYHVKCCENEARGLGASAKINTQQSLLQNQMSQQRKMSSSNLITNAAAGIDKIAMTGDLRAAKTASILLETQQQEDCGLHHITKAT